MDGLQICGSSSKPHGARGISKQYHLRFDPKLDNVICGRTLYHVLVLHVHQC